MLQHVNRVQYHYSITIEHEHSADLTAWGLRANAIFFLTDTSVTDPQWRVLVNPADGSASPDAELPYPADATNRKEHHEAWLKGEDIPVMSSLPPTLGESEVLMRSPKHVAKRLAALTLVAIRAESLSSERPIEPAEMRDRFPSVFDALSPNERAFMKTAAPSPLTAIDFAWKYEAAATLRWALKRTDDFPFPDQLCDVATTAADFVKIGYDALLADATLRPTPDILNQADLHLRLHWAARQARIKQTDPPRGLLSVVVQERRQALNWLIRLGDAEWDDVDTST